MDVGVNKIKVELPIHMDRLFHPNFVIHMHRAHRAVIFAVAELSSDDSMLLY